MLLAALPEPGQLVHLVVESFDHPRLRVHAVRDDVGAEPAVQTDIQRLAPALGRPVFILFELVTKNPLVVLLLGISIGLQYSTRKRIKRMQERQEGMQATQTDGGRDRPRDDQARFKSPDDDGPSGGLIGGAIAGAAVGSSAGPGGMLAGAIMGR